MPITDGNDNGPGNTVKTSKGSGVDITRLLIQSWINNFNAGVRPNVSQPEYDAIQKLSREITKFNTTRIGGGRTKSEVDNRTAFQKWATSNPNGPSPLAKKLTPYVPNKGNGDTWYGSGWGNAMAPLYLDPIRIADRLARDWATGRATAGEIVKKAVDNYPKYITSSGKVTDTPLPPSIFFNGRNVHTMQNYANKIKTDPSEVKAPKKPLAARGPWLPGVAGPGIKKDL